MTPATAAATLSNQGLAVTYAVGKTAQRGG